MAHVDGPLKITQLSAAVIFSFVGNMLFDFSFKPFTSLLSPRQTLLSRRARGGNNRKYRKTYFPKEAHHISKHDIWDIGDQVQGGSHTLHPLPSAPSSLGHALELPQDQEGSSAFFPHHVVWPPPALDNLSFHDLHPGSPASVRSERRPEALPPSCTCSRPR